MRQLDGQTLEGLWAALPTPWTESGRLDFDAIEHNVELMAEVGIEGVYTTDSDGEFYAIEAREFAELAEAFGAAVARTGLDAAMGASWINTAGVIERMKISADAGITNFHIALPMFVPVSEPDLFRFWEDLAAGCTEGRFVHYAHPECGPRITAAQYELLATTYPDQFIGTKLTPATSVRELTDIIGTTPQLAHFVTDPHLMVGMLLGASGVYSYWVNTLPRWQKSYLQSCRDGKWEEARKYHTKLVRWDLEYFKPFIDRGHQHAALAKARASLSGLVRSQEWCRAPYYELTEDERDQLQAAFDQVWAEELAAESTGVPT